MDLDGVWKGVYIDPRHSEPEFPIRARFDVAGRHFTGTMFDERTRTESSVQEVIDLISDDSHELALWREFAREYPDAVYSSTLPENSRIRGVIRGKTVRFTKEYLGKSEGTWTATDFETAVEESPCGPVVYEGDLDETGSEIRGTWRVYECRFWGIVRQEAGRGEFWLSRVSGG